MDKELQSIIDIFNRMLHIYSVLDKKPKMYGTGDLLYVSEIHAIHFIRNNPEINITQLAEFLGVTKGAISQTVKRLVSKRYIAKYYGRNKKEVNLRLSDKGFIIYQGYQTFNKEMLLFAEKLYENASPEEIGLVKGLFQIIYENMKKILDRYYNI
jgi:DNA-binding MarR family transcriptional regulator